MKLLGRIVQYLFRVCVVLLVPIMVLTLFCTMKSSRDCLQTSRYTLEATKLDSGNVKIVQLSDIHNAEFGKDNCELLALVAQEKPDIILLTGDVINRKSEDTEPAEKLIGELCKIAPTYISLGNHEVDHEMRYDVDLTAVFERAGATVLQQEFVDLDIRGAKIRLGGTDGYCLAAKYLWTGEAKIDECTYLAEFQDTDRYTILMCHIPVAWMINGSLDEWDVDCVFAGHTHGGQVVLPVLGGAHVSDLGWFPGQLDGLFYSQDKSKILVLSRGLGSSAPIPRINNVPEIVVVEIK